MNILKAILNSKVTTALALLAALLGMLADPQWAGLFPENVAAWAATAGTVVAAIARALFDTDGDGIPDFLDRDT